MTAHIRGLVEVSGLLVIPQRLLETRTPISTLSDVQGLQGAYFDVSMPRTGYEEPTKANPSSHPSIPQH